MFFISSEKVLRVVGRGLEEGVPVASPSPSEIGLRLSAAGQEVLKAVEEALLEGVKDLHMKRVIHEKKYWSQGNQICTMCYATIAYKCCYFVNGKIKSPPQQQQQQQQQHRQFHDLVFAAD